MAALRRGVSALLTALALYSLWRRARAGLVARGALAMGALLALRALWQRARRGNRVTFKADSALTTRIVGRLSGVLHEYRAPVWLCGGLLQTASTEVLPVPQLALRRERVELPRLQTEADHTTCSPKDVPAGVVSLDWLDVEREDAPIALIVPGLTGDSGSGYVRRVARELHDKHGFRVACYNPRGRGGNEVAAPFLYSVGWTGDLRRVVRRIRDKYPRARLMAAGFSLGSNYLAKYVGEEGEQCELSAAVCLACPVDCLMISVQLESTLLGRLMDPVLVRSVQALRRQLEHLLKEDPRYDLAAAEAAKTMHEFDGAVIAPMFEFSSASAYYRWSSAGLFLDQIRVPTLFLHAENDPIVASKTIKMDDFSRSPYLISVMTREGGHSMDWPLASLRPWSAEVIGRFFHAAAHELPVRACASSAAGTAAPVAPARPAPGRADRI